MDSLPSDPLAALIRLRIEELRREAAADSRARAGRTRRTRQWSWPASVAAAMRETFARATSTARPKWRRAAASRPGTCLPEGPHRPATCPLEESRDHN
jgi:hypothetical protein